MSRTLSLCLQEPCKMLMGRSARRRNYANLRFPLLVRLIKYQLVSFYGFLRASEDGWSTRHPAGGARWPTLVARGCSGGCITTTAAAVRCLLVLALYYSRHCRVQGGRCSSSTSLSVFRHAICLLPHSLPLICHLLHTSFSP